MEDNNLNKRMQAIEDKLALKEVVDTFSILADAKDLHAQIFLFTENAVVESYFNGKLALTFNGRKEIEDGFTAFIKNYETVYHINGQQTVKINGDKATAISYCSVTLIGEENGKKMKTGLGVSYNDEFERIDNAWLISKRKSSFNWQDKKEFGQQVI